MIRLLGYILDRDIEIVYTGLRPREKLYKKLLMNEEGLQDTVNKHIHTGKSIDFDEENFLVRVEAVCNEAADEVDNIRELELVTTYHYKKE